MNQPAYILSACAISPQHTFNPEQFLQPVMSADNGQLYAIDADYTRYISPVAIRRMSKLLKMGISAGMKCLQEAGVAQPDGIITGTAHGSVTDMERFLKDMIEQEEGVLNPTYFIQSTYNSINGWIAVQSKSTCYNQTYVHRGFSMELALFDAQMMLQETDAAMRILVGCFEELTPEYFFIKDKKDYWKKDIPNSLEVLQHSDTPGTIGGEGTAFFVLSNEKGNAACAIQAIQMLQAPAVITLNDAIDKMLQQQGLSHEDIDVLLCGISGDNSTQTLFDSTITKAGPNTTIAAFKHLCGEYETCTGFALWLANHIFTIQSIPEQAVYKKGNTEKVKHLLICNRSILNNVTLILVSGV
jgi:3-oxoacyl-[acyl-carrier-protein] synthase II